MLTAATSPASVYPGKSTRTVTGQIRMGAEQYCHARQAAGGMLPGSFPRGMIKVPVIGLSSLCSFFQKRTDPKHPDEAIIAGFQASSHIQRPETLLPYAIKVKARCDSFQRKEASRVELIQHWR